MTRQLSEGGTCAHRRCYYHMSGKKPVWTWPICAHYLGWVPWVNRGGTQHTLRVPCAAPTAVPVFSTSPRPPISGGAQWIIVQQPGVTGLLAASPTFRMPPGLASIGRCLNESENDTKIKNEMIDSGLDTGETSA